MYNIHIYMRRIADEIYKYADDMYLHITGIIGSGLSIQRYHYTHSCTCINTLNVYMHVR